MKTVDLVCKGCGAIFARPIKEVTRQRKRKGDASFFCTCRCFTASKGKHNLGPLLYQGRPGNLRSGSVTDEWSPFRIYLKLASQRKEQDNDLDLPYLKQLWESQQGRCGLTGLQLRLPCKMQDWQARKKDPFKPSLDRIDGNLGYVKGNVRYVSVIANLARSCFSDQQVLDWCLAVARHKLDL